MREAQRCLRLVTTLVDFDCYGTRLFLQIRHSSLRLLSFSNHTVEVSAECSDGFLVDPFRLLSSTVRRSQ